MKRPEPWVKTHYGIIGRCNNPKSNYHKNEIKCLISRNQLKELWFRDRAYEMYKPSIDRINSKGNYIMSNCRYIEHSENARLGSLGRKLNAKQIKAITETIRKVNNNPKNKYRRKITNGEKTFNSLTEAAKYYNICISSIGNCLTGRSKISKGYRWKYVN